MLNARERAYLAHTIQSMLPPETAFVLLYHTNDMPENEAECLGTTAHPLMQTILTDGFSQSGEMKSIQEPPKDN